MRINSVKARLRRSMYETFEAALCAAGITHRHRDAFVDRGDGVFALVRPLDDIPKTVLLHTAIPVLDQLLTVHNSQHPEARLRLRAAIHAGEVHYDENGCYGEALDVTFRLLDAAQVKRELRRTAGSLVLVTSEHIYRTVVRQGYSGIDERSYRACGTVTVAEKRRRVYLHTPGDQSVVTLRGRDALKPRPGRSPGPEQLTVRESFGVRVGA